ncbi:MAG: L-threonylcarbamoyladenylate synthase, partial [Verrucomicrobiota bacterium]
MQTDVVAGNAAVARAVALLRAGEVVALPTETVYGLAADALSPAAVARIFAVKERPRHDPLIVHLPTAAAVEEVATVPSEIERRLIEDFWPGPLTLLLTKHERVPFLVTAGRETIAVRCSAHPVFQKIIRDFGRPLAAPSANRFGRISPTTAQHVAEELGGRIPLIVDAGRTDHGIESTIVRVVGKNIEILRPGALAEEALEPYGMVQRASRPSAVIAPGQLDSHYSPQTKLLILEQDTLFDPADHFEQRIGLLQLQPTAGGENAFPPACVRYLSGKGDLREAASNLFGALRELDGFGLDLIVARFVPEQGIGLAI